VLALGQRLARAGSRLAPERRAALLALGNRLQQALKVALAMEASRLAGRRERLAGAAARLSPAALRGVTRQRERLLGLAKLLASVDHANVLRRGFALVRGSAGEVLTSRHAAAALGSAPVSLHWADGSIGAVLNAEARPTLPRPRPRKAAQDDLFG
jgi:exodeoxyribonuclease VII large subunit